MAYHGKKRLYRDTAEGKVGGVCAGMSEYFRVDVTILRVVAFVLMFVYGTGFLAYVALWIFLPEKNSVV